MANDAENVFKILVGELTTLLTWIIVHNSCGESFAYCFHAAISVVCVCVCVVCVCAAATDNHVGYLEKDQIRGTDSLEAFEEVLRIAQEQQVYI